MTSRSDKKRKTSTARSSDDGRGSHKKQIQEGRTRYSRRVARDVDYHGRESLSEEDYPVEEEPYPECQTESEAASQTGLGSSNARRLYKMELFDENMNLQSIDSETRPLFIRGIVQPLEGPVGKATGRSLSSFGPMIKWTVVYSKANPKIEIYTEDYVYSCESASQKYSPFYSRLKDRAAIANQVYIQLSSPGNIDDDFESVISKLQRSKVKHKYRTWREAVISNRDFILEQLCRMSSQHDKDDMRFEESPFTCALEKYGRGIDISVNSSNKAALTNSQITSDELLAIELQAQEEAKPLPPSHRDSGGSLCFLPPMTEDDIADEYPMPKVYEKDEEEIDEFVLAEPDDHVLPPEDRPTRILDDFSIYDSDGWLKTLELLLSHGTVPPVELYASGIVKEDDSYAPEGFSGLYEAGSSSGGGGSSKDLPASDSPSMRIYLSQIQDYVIECAADSASISICSEVAWYRLERPSAAYEPWFSIAIKWARIAVKIMGLILNEKRAAKLSFNDVTSLLAREGPDSDIFISRNASEVGRLLVTHGHFILHQFNHFPRQNSVKNISFVKTLRDHLTTKANCKSMMINRTVRRTTCTKSSTSSPGSASNQNPMKDRVANVKAKMMPASATVLVQSIWKDYFSVNKGGSEGADGDDDISDLDLFDCEAAVGLGCSGSHRSASPVPSEVVEKSSGKPVLPLSFSEESDPPSVPFNVFYSVLDKKGDKISSGDVVETVDLAEEYSVDGTEFVKQPEKLRGSTLGMVQCFFEEGFVQIRHIARGIDTVLGNAASEDELFLTSKWSILEATKISLPLKPTVRVITAEESVQDGENGWFVRLVYEPDEGMFCSIKDLALGIPNLAEVVETDQAVMKDKNRFIMNGVEYAVNEKVFFDPEVIKDGGRAPRKSPVKTLSYTTCRDTKGSIKGLNPFGIGIILSIKPMNKSSKVVKEIKVRRYVRPSEISEELELSADFNEIYTSSLELEIKPEQIIRKCNVVDFPPGEDCDDVFMCRGEVHLNENGEKMLNLNSPSPKPQTQSAECTERRLKTFDIFAGCGGLSEGMHQSGVAETKWAVEYDDAAAEAFRLNHPNATVLCENVSALLCRVMSDQGRSAECCSSDQVWQLAAKISDSALRSMPKPGEVDLMCGGPPCQGFSGMNRFNKGQWSVTQNSMVMNYLSFADYYRPRYFLLENVRNFVSHNSSRTFRWTLRTLVEMGYQVRFGVLNAGNYGVPQSRKRTFIWAALPKENLPEWPLPTHVFHSPQMKIRLPGGIDYTVMKDLRGAPFRTVTVQDAISDLPSIKNGDNKIEKEYVKEPETCYQRKIRGDCTTLRDHICKTMNALNLYRCKCIPKNTPGADWRTLKEIVEADPKRATYNGQPLIPCCLPNTAERHNNWRGLFGRLDRRGHFATSTTDPQPMGKVGQVFHPDQDRIVSVRECARSQGFPDRYIFYGTIHQKHKQVGNAVPPPLAYALGRCLKKALAVETKD